MRQCKKICIANTNGWCAVEKCKGAIRSTAKRKINFTPEQAAEHYEISQELFKNVFESKENND